MLRTDLHVHTHASDGQLSPSAVVLAAAAAGLHVISITDHDTVAGVREATEAARGLQVRVLPGIELSTRHEGSEIHVLGYLVDPESPPLRAYEAEAIARRQERMRRMVERLQALGVRVAYEDVIRAAGVDAATVGRPHLARALLAGGHTRYYGEAFDLYLHDGGSAFVPTEFPGVRTAIETIHAAGGVAVWAHPPVALFDREVRTFVEWGLDGVECFRPNTPPAESLLLETAARELGMFPTGGSDWHGPHRTRLGDFWVRGDHVRELLQLASVA